MVYNIWDKYVIIIFTDKYNLTERVEVATLYVLCYFQNDGK